MISMAAGRHNLSAPGARSHWWSAPTSKRLDLETGCADLAELPLPDILRNYWGTLARHAKLCRSSGEVGERVAEARAHRLRGLKNRDATLAAATDLWAEYGYAGTSLAMIATRVGISQAGLLHHFGSKDQLLLAAVERHGQHHREQLAQLDGLVGTAAFEALFELVRNSLTDLRPSRLFAALQRDGMIEDNPAAQFIDDHYAILRQYLLSAIERGIVAGSVAPEVDATTVVNLTMAMCDGISIQAIIGRTVPNRELALARDYVTKLLSPAAGSATVSQRVAD
jgi:AcrR family transcriptional regulator